MSVTVSRTGTVVPMRPVLVPQTFDQLMTFADMAAQSDLMPKDYRGKPANIMIAVQMGSELGLAPMQALNSIAVINGRPGVWGDGLIGLCRQSPLCEDIQESFVGEGDAMTAVCVAKRRGASPVTARFSVADAKKAGLWAKDIWAKYPARMLQNRARGFALRDAFPDLLRGLKTVEELRDTPIDDFRGTTLDQPVKAAQPTRQGSVVDADTIPTMDPEPQPTRDEPAEKAARLIARIEAVTAEDDLHVIAGDANVAKGRTWFSANRPELEQRIAAAFDDTYARLTALPADDDENLPGDTIAREQAAGVS